jgi:hypothetical protein
MRLQRFLNRAELSAEFQQAAESTGGHR